MCLCLLFEDLGPRMASIFIDQNLTNHAHSLNSFTLAILFLEGAEVLYVVDVFDA